MVTPPEYCRLDCIYEAPDSARSPVVLIHGFPDSPQMFAAYTTAAERQQPWLSGRSLYTFAFPNRHTHPAFPPVSALRQGVLAREFAAWLDDLAGRSPTGRLAVIAHDWGATYTWQYARARRDPPIEKLVALSVGSSFRYDFGEHGLRALTWLYGAWFGSAWYVPALRGLVARSIIAGAGYRSATAGELWRDAYHYWDRLAWLPTMPLYALGLVGRQPEYLDFPFPVLYLRSPLDRIASTAAFERALDARPDCRRVILTDANHWFPEQHSARVLAEIRPFLTD